MPKLRVVLCVALLAGAGAVQAQPLEPLNANEREARRWAAVSLNPSALPQAWARLQSGDLDAFSTRAQEMTRVFPSPSSQVAAAVTWSRPADPLHGLEVTANVSLRDRSGRELAAFAVEPLQSFDVSDDGAFVVAHGEEMNRLLECGAFNTHLVFYSRDGKKLGRVERLDFAPGVSTTILTSARQFVIGTTGRVVGYGLSDGREAWTLPLAAKDDRPDIAVTPAGDAVAVVSNTMSGTARLLLVDAGGVTRATRSIEGRVNPGSGFGFAQDLLVVQEIEDDRATYQLLDPRTLRSLRSVRAN